MNRHNVHPAEEHAEESYLASLSDLMVGMLFFFIILLMAFALNYHAAEKESDDAKKESNDAKKESNDAKKESNDAKKESAEQSMVFHLKSEAAERERQLLIAKEEHLTLELATLKRERDVLVGVTNELTNNDAKRADMLRRIKAELERQHIEVILDEENGSLLLPEQRYFEKGDDLLKPDGREKIAKLGRVLEPIVAEFVQSGSNARLEAVLVEGHTDNDPVRGGPKKDNWNLSAQRALNTFSVMRESAPALDELKNARGQRIFAVSGYGETRPVHDNATEEHKTENRRIALRFLMSAPTRKEREDAQKRANPAPP